MFVGLKSVLKSLHGVAFAGLAALTFAAAPLAAQPAKDDDAPINSTEALKSAEASVYRIVVTGIDYYGNEYLMGTGSGFLISPGHVLTNRHVVNVQTDPRFYSYGLYAVPNQARGTQMVAATVKAVSSRADMALLTLDSGDATPLNLSPLIEKSDAVHAMGYPGIADSLLGKTGRDRVTPSDAVVTNGEVSLLAERNPIGEALATVFHTAPINPGNSGGPLVNDCGQVVGINTWGAAITQDSNGGYNANAGTLVSTHASVIKTFLDEVGVSVEPVTRRCFAKTAEEIKHEEQLRQVREEERLAADTALKYERDQNKAFQKTIFIALGLICALVVAVIAYLVWSRHKKSVAALPPSPSPVIAPEATATTPPSEVVTPSPPSGVPVPPLSSATQKLKTALPLLADFPLPILILAVAVIGFGVLILLLGAVLLMKPKATSYDVNCQPVSWATAEKPTDIEFLFEPTRQCRNAHEFFERLGDGSYARVEGSGPHSLSYLSKDMKTLTVKDSSKKFNWGFMSGNTSNALPAQTSPESCPAAKDATERASRNAAALDIRGKVENGPNWTTPAEGGTVYSCTARAWR